LSAERNVVDFEEIYRALSNLGLAKDYAEAAASAMLDEPLAAILCGTELAIIISRIRHIYSSCLAASSNYKNMEFGLPGTFESETAGTAPALALALAGAMSYLPNVGQGMSAAISGKEFEATRPSSLAQLIGRLNALQSAHPGTLRIEQYRDSGQVGSAPAENGGRQFIVYLPGMSSNPQVAAAQPFNLTSGIYSMAGAGASDAEVATLSAMKLAGIGTKAGDRVTFVGYSEGALVAANIAKSGKYKVSGLVSVGGPIGNVKLPKDIPVLAIENKNDLMAKLDLKENPNYKNLLTVKLDGSNVFQAHDIQVYDDQAKHVDAGGYSALQRKLQEILPQQPVTDSANPAGSQQTSNRIYQTQLIG
jgi:hypothetical protein